MFVAAGIVLLADLLPGGDRRRALVGISLAGAVASALYTLSLLARDVDGLAFSRSVVLDRFSLFFYLLFPAITGFVIISSIDYLEEMRDRIGEYLALLLVVCGGAMLLSASNDLIIIFIALELQSVSQYVLAGFRRDARSSEAGLKYLLLGA